MDPDARFAYTVAMREAEVEAHLRRAGHGVLSLAADGDSYAIPLYHYYDDGRLFFRLGETPGNRKATFVESTDTATYVVYAADETTDPEGALGWSIVARGPIERVAEAHPAYDIGAINERFAPIRLFDEAHDDVELTLYVLTCEELTGRRN